MRISTSITETGSTVETFTDEQWRALLRHLPSESAVNTPCLREIAEAIPQFVRGDGSPTTDLEEITPRLFQSRSDAGKSSRRFWFEPSSHAG